MIYVLIWSLVIMSITTTLFMSVHLLDKRGVEDEEVTEKDLILEAENNIGVIENIRRLKRHGKKPLQRAIEEYQKSIREICDTESSQLRGRLDVDSLKNVSLDDAMASGGESVVNGCYVPPSCGALQKVAIVIPYKNRMEHLLMLTNHLHPILQRQNIMYCIFVAEQYDNGSFNKAQIMNSAFKEITTNYNAYGHPADVDKHGRRRPFDCFVFHDVDMLMENDHNLYMCEKFPKHLSPSIDKFNYSGHYGTIYGGVTAMKTETYQLVNGHSNRFWGWGGEDNDMEKRIANVGEKIIHVNPEIGRYKMIVHEHPWWFSPETGAGSWMRLKASKMKSVHSTPKKKKKAATDGKDTYEDETGLSNIKYQLVYTSHHLLWTKLMIDIRYHVFEKSLTHFTNYETDDVWVESPQLMPGSSDPDADGVVYKHTPDKELEPCEPVYHTFTGLTINNTMPKTDQRYQTVYMSLERAQKLCNAMRLGCRAIVEQKPGMYSLRSTAYLQRNKLRYKMNIMEQNDVFEEHETAAVHVKICPHDQRYTQFHTEPLMIVKDGLRAQHPTFRTSFTIRALQSTNMSYTYRTRTTSVHREVMEAGFNAHGIQSLWWDSLGQMQFARSHMMNFTDVEAIQKLKVIGESSTNSSRVKSVVYSVQSASTSISPYPGCYITKHFVVDDESEEPVYQWETWMQLKGKTVEVEDEMLNEQLRESIRTGEDYRKQQDKNKQRAIQLMHARRVKPGRFFRKV